MAKRVFLAGATGAIGRSLVPQLVEAGHTVFGTTRSEDKAAELRRMGVQPVVLNAFDREALMKAMAEANPEVVIIQLTDLPKVLTGPFSPEMAEANARLRRDGTRNLIDGALASGARRVIAQSLAWVYAPGREPHIEDDPLDIEAKVAGKATIDGVVALERLTLGSPPLEGIVLRYGQLYGPGTWDQAQGGRVPVHVDAAGLAAVLAVETPHLGAFNIAEERGLVSSAKARRELMWNATYRRPGSAGV